MKKILVLCSGYPDIDNPYNCTWAHTRNRYYILHGVDVHVHQVGANVTYQLDGVSVIGVNELEKNIKSRFYDVVISHSPNIRRHIPILQKIKDIPILLFMHGSESMYIEKDYPKPYPYMESPFYKKFARNVYDNVKFKLLANFIRKNKDRITLVFVSDWMRAMFENNVLNPAKEEVKYEIIHNSLNEVFLVDRFKQEAPKVGDFVTLRRLDFSKFAVDMVVSLAEANPDYTFDIYGRGRFFSFNKKPENLNWHDKHINQDDIPALLNGYRCALMPTRCDAQGVMACEIATYGMPLITTDIAVNREMFSNFQNVKLLRFEDFSKKISIDNYCCPLMEKNYKFSHERTLLREISVINSL